MDRGRIRVVGATVVLCTAILGASAPAASVATVTPALYWEDGSTGNIGTAGIDGSSVNTSLLSPADNMSGLAADAQHLYWVNHLKTRIARADLDGGNADATFIGVSAADEVAVDAEHIYWSSNGTTIGRANLDGTGADQNFITGLGTTTGIAVDGRYVYWADTSSNTIGRAKLDGSDVDTSFITGIGTAVQGVAVDGQHVYWSRNSGGGFVGRANLDGSGANASFISTGGQPNGVAVDSAHVYWADGNGKIGRADLDGSSPNASFISGGLTAPHQLAVLATPGAPTGVSVTAGVRQATVGFSAPVSNGNLPITSYTVTASPGGASASGSQGPLTLTGLTNGTSYTFAVTATNAAGTSVSATSGATLVDATETTLGSSLDPARVGQPVTFTAAVTGSSPTGTVLFQDGANVVDGCHSRPLSAGIASCTTSSLTVGSHQIVAIYGGDAANGSSTSEAFTETIEATAPDPPTGVSVSAADGEATVIFTPGSSGGLRVSGYTVTAEPGGITASGTGSPITVTGLANGTEYTFTVVAANSAGTSVASTAVTGTPAAAAPSQPPVAVSGLTGTLTGGGVLTLAWPAGNSQGVDHYVVYLNGIPLETLPATATSADVHAFDPGAPAEYTVRAVDAAGNQGEVVSTITVAPVARPAGVPTRIPAWAWKLFRFQQHHGARPKTPKPLPRWYAAWRQWRLHRYTLSS